MNRMAGLALAGAGLGAAGLGIAGATGNLPVSKQQELEQLKAQGIEPTPEQEEEAKNEQMAMWATAALATGAGTGLGLSVDRFAGSPEVQSAIDELGSGGGSADAPLPASPPQGPRPGGGTGSGGRLATEDDAKLLVNLMTRHFTNDPNVLRMEKRGVREVAERIRNAGPEALGAALDLVEANWDGEMSGLQGAIDFINAHGKQLVSEHNLYQRIVDSVTPEMLAERDKHSGVGDFIDTLVLGDEFQQGKLLLGSAVENASLTAQERRLAAAAQIMIDKSGIDALPRRMVEDYLYSLDRGQAGEYQDRVRAYYEASGLNSDDFVLPAWAMNHPGNGADPFDYLEPEESVKVSVAHDNSLRREGGLPDMNEQEIESRRAFALLRDKHRRLRLGL